MLKVACASVPGEMQCRPASTGEWLVVDTKGGRSVAVVVTPASGIMAVGNGMPCGYVSAWTTLRHDVTSTSSLPLTGHS